MAKAAKISSKKKPEKTTTRLRRSAEDARAQILDAAEAMLLEKGPDGIRLQDVAAKVGVSHPAVLHHFESREGLVQAVVKRALKALEGDLVATFHSSTGEAPDPNAMFDRVFDMLSNRGHARLLAWLALSGSVDALDTKETRENWKMIIDATHALRLADVAGAGGGPPGTAPARPREPDYEDTLFTVVLSSLALFGLSIAGDATFRFTGKSGDPGVQRRFRTWLGQLLMSHMSG